MYEIAIVSKLFEGKSLLQQHRMVNELLSAELKTMHGLTLITKTPAQWEKIKKQPE